MSLIFSDDPLSDSTVRKIQTDIAYAEHALARGRGDDRLPEDAVRVLQERLTRWTAILKAGKHPLRAGEVLQ